MELIFFLTGFFSGGFAVWIFLKEKISYNAKHKEKELIKTLDETISKNNKLFLEILNQKLEFFAEKNRSVYTENKLEMEKIVNPLKENLHSYQNLIKEFANKNFENIGQLKAHLHSLEKYQYELQKQTQALTDALKTPQIRGKWGEIHLRKIVEFAGLTEYVDFDEQKNFFDKGVNLRPDMIINLPAGKKIIVDSKMPLTNFLKIFETQNENERKKYLSAHVKDIKRHIKNLSSKEYWKTNGNNPEFVIMYINIENALTYALQQDPELLISALEKNVVITTPFTFIALLQIISHIWKQHKVNENAEKILILAREFAKRMDIFTGYLAELGDDIKKTNEKYNKITASWNSRLKPTLEKFKTLGINFQKLNDISTIEK